jgi:hypothetical protein
MPAAISNMLQIQMFYNIAIAVSRVGNYFSLYLIKYSAIIQMFQGKNANVNYIYILCTVFL